MSEIRVAAMDCGTNSLRLLIADLDLESGTLTERLRRMEVVRLGQGVDQTGRLDPVALERTIAVAGEYARLINEAGASQVRCVATSATRDADNSDEFVHRFHEVVGVEPEVISGAHEAALSFRGATRQVAHTAPGPYLVVDLGGGSTELVLGDTHVSAAYSMDIGCVRMTERHFATDPPTTEQITAAQRDIDHALAQAARHVPFDHVRTVVGVAGSVTTVTAYALGLDRYRPDVINGAVIPRTDVVTACHQLMAMPREQRSALGFMHPGRVDVIAAGALVWSRVVETVAHQMAAAGRSLDTVVTSELDILDGIALSLGD